MRSRALLVLVLAAEAVGLLVVWTRVPVADPPEWGRLPDWLARNDPEAVLLAGGRLAALALGAWLLLGTLLAIGARLCGAWGRAPRLGAVADAAARIAPGAVRHLVEGAIAVSLVSGTVGTRPAVATDAVRYPAAAVAAPRPVVEPLAPLRTGRAPVVPSGPAGTSAAAPAPPPDRPAVAPPTRGAPSAPTTTTPPAPAPETVPGTTAGALAPSSGGLPGQAPARVPGGRHLVGVGDSLWSVARGHLRAAGLPVDDATVAAYWRILCDANREALASGDVDLIHPGEELDLPPVA